MNKKITEFKRVASEAVTYEREGNLKMAAMMWDEASELAKKEANRSYAKNRADYCRRWANVN